MQTNPFYECAELINNGGHWKGGQWNQGHCVLTALAGRVNAPAFDFFCRHLNRFGIGGSVVRWNDAPERTADDVVWLFKQLGELWDIEQEAGE